MKIVADENIPGIDEFLADIGNICRLPGRAITWDDVHDADVLLVRSITQVNEALLQGSSVRFVASATAGIDHIDQSYLESTGITFAWAPGCNAIAVAEYVLAAVIEAYAAKGAEWCTKTVGIIGRGHVGYNLHKRLLRIGVQCLIYDPLAPAGDSSDVPLDTLLKESDIVTLHTPLTRSGPFPTWHLIDERALKIMKPDALLINAARGGVVDQQALLSHMHDYPDFMVVLDVWEGEPTVDRSLLEQAFLGTGHIAGHSLEGKLKGAQMIYEALCRYLKRPVVTSMETLIADYSVRIRHEKKPALALLSLVRQAYAIREDAHRFTSLILGADNPAETFDHYRKTYPVRREFSYAALNKLDSEMLHQNPKLPALFAGVGFDRLLK